MLTHISRPIEGDLSQPQVIRSKIREIHVNQLDNSLTFEVVDNLGNFYSDVSFIVAAPGGNFSFTQPPFRVGDEVYLLKTTANAPVYIIGSVYKSGLNVVQTTPVIPSTNEDDKTAAASDYIFENDGNRINLADSRGVVIDANPSVRIQLGTNGYLRISKDGQAEELAINGITFIDNLYQYTSELRARNKQLEVVVDKMQTQLSLLQDAFDSFMLAASGSTDVAIVTFVNTVYNTTYKADLAARDLDTQEEVNEIIALPLRTNSSAEAAAVDSLNPYIKLPRVR
jgi:hypothetical protein